MISLDQVYLLEEKVESAVKKIQQLQAENDALRNKCSELTNALSRKTEQLNTFSVDQNQIEEGIKKALDRLNSIEHSILGKVDQVPSAPVDNTEANTRAAVIQSIIDTPAVLPSNPIKKNPASQQTEEELAIKETFQITEEPEVQEDISSISETAPDFSNMTEITSKSDDLSSQISEETDFENQNSESEEEEDPDGLGFDIF